jgi:hypothetical protein
LDESKTPAERGPKGTAQGGSAPCGELGDGPATRSHTVRAAANDAVRAALALGHDSPDAAVAVRHLIARLGEQHGPQFVQDVAAVLVVKLAEATTAMAAETGA